MSAALATQTRFTTVEEFWMLSQRDGFWGELINGEVCELTPPGSEHGAISSNILEILGVFVRKHKLGRMFSECGYVITRDPDSVRAPDVSFVAAHRQESPPSKKFSETLPDLAVEVVSPSDTYSDVIEKARMYLAAGVKEVWIVDPSGKTVEIFRTLHESRILRVNDNIETPLLPGLSVPVSEFFE